MRCSSIRRRGRLARRRRTGAFRSAGTKLEVEGEHAVAAPVVEVRPRLASCLAITAPAPRCRPARSRGSSPRPRRSWRRARKRNSRQAQAQPSRQAEAEAEGVRSPVDPWALAPPRPPSLESPARAERSRRRSAWAPGHRRGCATHRPAWSSVSGTRHWQRATRRGLRRTNRRSGSSSPRRRPCTCRHTRVLRPPQRLRRRPRPRSPTTSRRRCHRRWLSATVGATANPAVTGTAETGDGPSSRLWS